MLKTKIFESQIHYIYFLDLILNVHKETVEPGVNHRSAVSHWQTLSHNVVSSTPRRSGIRTHHFSADR
jgi:hypothetical protein